MPDAVGTCNWGGCEAPTDGYVRDRRDGMVWLCRTHLEAARENQAENAVRARERERQRWANKAAQPSLFSIDGDALRASDNGQITSTWRSRPE